MLKGIAEATAEPLDAAALEAWSADEAWDLLAELDEGLAALGERKAEVVAALEGR